MRITAIAEQARQWAWQQAAHLPHTPACQATAPKEPAQLEAKKTFQWLERSYLTFAWTVCQCVCKCVCVSGVVCVLVVNSFWEYLQLYAATCHEKGRQAWPVVCILQHCS